MVFDSLRAKITTNYIHCVSKNSSEPPKTGSQPAGGCQHPLGRQTQIQGVSDSGKYYENSKFGGPQRLSQIWILINYDRGVSDQLGLTEGFRARTIRLGTRGVKRHDLTFWKQAPLTTC